MSYPNPYGGGYPSYPQYPTGQPGAQTPNYGFVQPQQPGQPQPYPHSYPGQPPQSSYPQSSYPGQQPAYPGYPPQQPQPPIGGSGGYGAPPAGYPHPQAGSTPGIYPGLQGNIVGSYPGSTGPTSGGNPSYPYPTSGYSQQQPLPPTSGYSAQQQQPQAPTQTFQQYQQQQQQQQQQPLPNLYSSPAYPKSASPKIYQEQSTMGTVREHQPFYPEEDAKALRKAMKGFGTDEKAIIDVLGHRTNAQRLHISVTYKTHFGRDLVQDLKSELGGRFEDVIIALMTPTSDYLANRIHKAISGLGTDEEAIIDILCAASNAQIREINAAYLRLYRTPLEKHLIGDTSGHFRRLLVSLSMGNRSESPDTDPGKASSDAQMLYQAGLAKWGTDESVFNSILVSQHYNQLKLVFAEYQRITGKSLEQSIKNEFSGDIETGLLAIVKCAQNTPGYYAEKLYHSMVGAGTDDRTLVRVVATRCEVDMVQIKQEFQRLYGKTLEGFIADDTSGDYKKILLALVQ